ncbi:MAG: glycosyltransferase, partial [Pseudomonadota bacterium]|nr:glycosyltransferase [Pseudomonadota bacterium]
MLKTLAPRSEIAPVASGAAGASPDRLDVIPRVLIICESASAAFGGEAALPLHYFRVLRKRGVPVWLLTHARTRGELSALFPDDPAIRYIEDTLLNRAMWQIGRRMPSRLSYFTAGFVSRFATQVAQRSIARRLVVEERIGIVHQPMPVSPREPSMMFGLGAPVVIGPMNGGMDYPEAFRRRSGTVEEFLVRAGRGCAAALNRLMPGKRQAALLLVANSRTREALPRGLCGNVVELVENGVDLSLWRPPAPGAEAAPSLRATRFIFLGRLVDWKAVDFLLHAFAEASVQAPMQLLIIGDGDDRRRLEALAGSLGLDRSQGKASASVTFTGWLPQQACAERLQDCDCLVLPSLLECGGAVVLEAMAIGKPVIATNWGGPADYLDASCGILVAPAGREGLISGLR